VIQNYNRANEEIVLGEIELSFTHDTLDGVSTSNFDIDYGGLTTRCPSLVDECPGRQKFDRKNDVAWLELEPGVLGVAWFGTKKKEVDIALNTDFNWNAGCSNENGKINAQTVLLHENLHLTGLGHSNDAGSVLQPFYSVANCSLGTDDIEGLTYLYDNDILGSISGTVTDGTEPIEGATVVLDGTSLRATTTANGFYTISNVPDPVTYTVTASADGFESDTLLRQTVDGAVTIDDFELTSSGDGNGGGKGGGGPPSCVPKKRCPQ